MGTIKPDGERIVAVETSLNDFKTTISTGLAETKNDIKSLLLEIKNIQLLLQDRYVTKDEFVAEIKAIREAVSNNNKLSWLTHTLTAILTAVVSILITLFFSKRL